MEDSFLECSESANKDACRWTLIVPKLILQGVSLWPEIKGRTTKILSVLLCCNITFMLVSHTAYFIENINDIAKMAELLTSVNINLQSFVKILAMLYYKKDFNALLQKVWKTFWFSHILQSSDNEQIKKKTKRHFILVVMYCMAATGTTLQFMYQPFIMGMRALPLMLKLPIDYSVSPTFEVLYVWSACTCMCIQFTVIGFDLFFTMLTWNCAVQFKMLRIVLQGIVVDSCTKRPIESNFSTDEVMIKEREETLKLVQCIEHHKHLIGVCEDMEVTFRYILLIQLLDSALAICVCCFAAVAVPQLFAKMMTFSVMMIMQLFLYCIFGNELMYQSRTIAYAAFRCGWHFTENKKIKKTIIMLMQKSQKGQFLTARGFFIVNYSSCLQVLKMAFSFYTLLDRLREKLKF